jgi:hypothetical protein
MKLADLIYAAGKLIANNGPVVAVMGLYAGIVVSYIDTI